MKDKALLLFLVALLAVYQLCVGGGQERFIGFEAIRWKDSSTCYLQNYISPRRADIKNGSFLPSPGECVSEAFRFQGEVLEFEFAGYPSENSSEGSWVEVLSGEESHRVYFSKEQNPKEWGTHRIVLPSQFIGTTGAIRFISGSTGERSWLGLRSRVNFYKKGHLSLFKDFFSKTPLRFALCLGIALLGGCLLCRNISLLGKLSTRTFFLLCFFLGFAVHFRAGLFYYWDEMHVFYRLFDEGIEAALTKHNEQRVPLFFLTYWGQGLLFGSAYSLIISLSLFLHALNTVLFAGLLEKLFGEGEEERSRVFSRCIALLYLFSFLHSASLQWGILQIVMLGQLLVLAGLHLGVRSFETKNRKTFWGTLTCVFLLPFFYGNGFIFIGLLGGILLFLFLGRGKGTFFLFCKLLLGTVIAYLPGVLYYVSVTEGPGMKYQIGFFDDFSKLSEFFYTATQFGVVLRGLGFFPVMQEEALARLSNLSFFTHIGFGVSFVLFLFCFFSKERKQNLGFFLLGSLFLCLPHVLISVGRWQFGQVFALRSYYNVQGLFGLFLMLVPLLQFFLERARVLGGVFLVFYFVSHLFGAMEYDFYILRGAENKNYVAQMLDWNKRLVQETGEKSVDYQARGTSLAFHQPLRPFQFSPQGPTRTIYQTLKRLDKKSYPFSFRDAEWPAVRERKMH